MNTVLCLGCGENITESTSDRRNLSTESSSHVLLFRKEIFLSKLENDRVEAETFAKDVIRNLRFSNLYLFTLPLPDLSRSLSME